MSFLLLNSLIKRANRDQNYINKVLGIGSSNLLALWPLNELSGSVAINAQGNVSRNGTYSNVSLGQTVGPFGSGLFGRWNGTTSYCDIFSASLQSAFSPTEGSCAAWVKLAAASVWSDGTSRRFINLLADSSNVVRLGRTTTLNTLEWIYRAGGTLETITSTSVGGTTSWFHVALTWSKSNDRVIAYLNGVQVNIATGLGVWVGNIATASTVLGSSSTTPANVLNGHLAYAAIWNKELSSTEVLELYNG